MAVTAYGVDVSHHQRITNFQSIRNNNITFCWHKATEGTSYTDPTFGGRVPAFRKVGIVTGAYHFARPGSAASQARYFRSKAGTCLKNGSLWPCLDMEDNSMRGNANSFINQFYDALGAKCLVVYANLDWWKNVLRPASWGNRNIVGWIARYNGNPGNPGYTYSKMAAHQHSDKGNVPGISSVDRNVLFNGYSLHNLTIGGTILKEADVPSAKDIVDELVSRDVFHYPWTTKKDNPTWRYDSMMESIWQYAYAAHPDFVWSADVIPVLNADGTPHTPDNKTWQAKSVLGACLQNLYIVEEKLAKMEAKMGTADEVTLTTEQLKALQAAVMAALEDAPEDVAKKVMGKLTGATISLEGKVA